MFADLLFSLLLSFLYCFFFFFNDTAPTEIYTLSLHDALPIAVRPAASFPGLDERHIRITARDPRSEEHTSELQSRENLVCRLLLDKQKKTQWPCDGRNHQYASPPMGSPPRRG